MSKLTPTKEIRIKPLSIQLANQIAAGEVVERPASVLKELLENSIDAGSDTIEIDIIKGGKGLIRVRDNGIGITKDDLPLAVSRHATSKLNTIEDLQHVTSLGFRGEALASVSSVSRLSIISKYEQDDKAWTIDTASDTDFTNYQAEVQPASLSSGTIIDVRDLFYNTPARRKFLRTDKTEFRYIEDVFKRIALSHFSIAFKLTHNKKLVKKLAAANNAGQRELRLQKLFGENFSEHFIQVNEISQEFHELGKLQLSGWISGRGYFRSQADQQFFYVNGRYVRDKLLNHALRQAYQEILPAEQYAAYILYLTINPDAVDVNVHPTKHEIRFRESRMVHDFIVSALLRSISPAMFGDNDSAENVDNSSYYSQNISSQYDYPPKNSSLPEMAQQGSIKYSGSGTKYISASRVNDQLDGLSELYHIHSANIKTPDDTDEAKEVFTGEIISLIGSIILAQTDEELWLVDGIKAGEIINKSTLFRQIENNGQASVSSVKSQRLLIPQAIDISANDCELLTKWQSTITHTGIKFTISGPQSLMLREMPKLPFATNYHSLFTSIIDIIGCTNDFDEEDNLQIRLIDSIASSIEQTQIIDKNKQQLILNSISQLHMSDIATQNIFSGTYQILGQEKLKKLLSLR